MRYRELLNSLEYAPKQAVRTSTVPADNKTYHVDEFISQQLYNAMLDVVTPNWRKLVAQGSIINNPMLQNSYIGTKRPIIFLSDWHDDLDPLHIWDWTVTEDLSFPVQATSIDWAAWNSGFFSEYESERDIALSKAWANVDISEVQALASLGELPETLHWMASLLKRMISILRAFTQKKLLLQGSKFLRSGTSIIDAMSELWLEMRYAIRPLVFDMKQAMNAWNSVIAKSDRFTARGYYRGTDQTSTSTFTRGVGSHWTGIVSRVQISSVNIRAGVLFTLDSDLNELRSVWGLDQPFEMIWELLPFSFIIDWFFSVGYTLSSWTSNPGLHPLASFLTEEYKITTTDTLSGVTAPAVIGTAVNDGITTQQIGMTKTEQLIKRRIPSPQRAILPHFNLRLDTAKLIDLATIGRNIFSTLRRS